ncbi:M23 family metallopeptidase [Paenibacillus protaetiae]|uniref:M23 family metallopeptidase n=1 Tax=Paenibacillus protaetiae TaxID=2509456 RepID=A0A4P6F194_9BACL|nr:M23 family metallopeptidase [Paenibacillus protaetiae]QAY66797.1 M23 family metallopeptidase [Paenibacillus protaetiae]
MATWPYDSHFKVTSPFGMRIHPIAGGLSFHRGIDLEASPADSPLYAFTDGTVLHAKEGAAGSGLGGYGITVAIKDIDGYLHCYAHLSATSVTVGQTVARGQLIGRQGSTGQSTGPHLHYEVRKASAPLFGYTATEAGVVNPTDYLNRYNARHGLLNPEEEKAMAAEDKQLMQALQAKAEQLEQRLAAIEAKHKLAAIPAWAADAVNAAAQAGIVDTPEGGSEDFYRLITVMHRAGLF